MYLWGAPLKQCHFRGAKFVDSTIALNDFRDFVTVPKVMARRLLSVARRALVMSLECFLNREHAKLQCYTRQNGLLGMSLDPKSQHRPHPKMGGLAGDFTPKMHHPKVYLTEVHLCMGVTSIGIIITTTIHPPDLDGSAANRSRSHPPHF